MLNICEYSFPKCESNETPLYETGINGSYKELLGIGDIMALSQNYRILLCAKHTLKSVIGVNLQSMLSKMSI